MARTKLLLHTCCAPCSGFVVTELLKKYLVTIYYSNSNIFPKKEYQKRLAEVKGFFDNNQVDLAEELYDHDQWLKLVKKMAD